MRRFPAVGDWRGGVQCLRKLCVKAIAYRDNITLAQKRLNRRYFSETTSVIL